MSGFGTVAGRVPSLKRRFPLQEVVDHRFEFTGCHPLSDAEQIAPSSHRADTPGDEEADSSDDAAAGSVPSVLPTPHIFDVSVQKAGQSEVGPGETPF